VLRGQGIAAFLGPLVLAACATDVPAPVLVEHSPALWTDTPITIPPRPEIEAEFYEAHDFYLREQFEWILDAHDPGELLEHATLTQLALDQGIYTNDELFVFGDELFEYEFRPENGFGDNVSGLGPTIHRVHRAQLGGPDAFSCGACHSKGGLDGAGASTQNAYFVAAGDLSSSSVERNPPHLLGQGPVEALAQEMTKALQTQRRTAIRTATTTGARIETSLSAKGVSFGVLAVSSEGRVDASQVEGVSEDLVIRPFGWKGRHATNREVVKFSFRVHLGLVSSVLQEKLRQGLVQIDDYGGGEWYDVDQDGVSLELEDGMLTSVSAYLAQLEIPILRPPEHPVLYEHFELGRKAFEEARCDTCHLPRLNLDDPKISIAPEHPDFQMGTIVSIDVATDGESPKIAYDDVEQTYVVELFSDLKRHDMGEDLASGSIDGDIPENQFLTRPLWGLAETAPYLHDGRAVSLDEAIQLHGGEAQDSRDAYMAMSEAQRKAIQVFLLSLSRTPKVEVR